MSPRWRLLALNTSSFEQFATRSASTTSPDADIARDLDISVNHVGRYFRGEVAIPTLAMHRIAHIFGLRLAITLLPDDD